MDERTRSRRDHVDDRHGQLGAQVLEAGGGGRVAGDDDRFGVVVLGQDDCQIRSLGQGDVPPGDRGMGEDLPQNGPMSFGKLFVVMAAEKPVDRLLVRDEGGYGGP